MGRARKGQTPRLGDADRGAFRMLSARERQIISTFGIEVVGRAEVRRSAWLLGRARRIERRLAAGSGGERGIRTLDTVSRIHAFQACAFSHSATSPNSHHLKAHAPFVKTRAKRAGAPSATRPGLQRALPDGVADFRQAPPSGAANLHIPVVIAMVCRDKRRRTAWPDENCPSGRATGYRQPP